MEKDYIEDVKSAVEKYKKEDIVFGKELDFILPRIKVSREEVESEVLSLNKLTLVEKQFKNGETRYALYFIYSKKKGRKYVITFRDNTLRIITIFPLGRKTLRKYRKKGLYTTNE